MSTWGFIGTLLFCVYLKFSNTKCFENIISQAYRDSSFQVILLSSWDKVDAPFFLTRASINQESFPNRFLWCRIISVTPGLSFSDEPH